MAPHCLCALLTFTSALSARPAASACRCSAAMAASAPVLADPMSPALRRAWPTTAPQAHVCVTRLAWAAAMPDAWHSQRQSQRVSCLSSHKGQHTS